MTNSQTIGLPRNNGVNIHPTAIVDPKAQLGERVSIGAFSVIGPHVVLGDDVEIMHHVVVDGRTRIGLDHKYFLLLRSVL
jgi:UDP-N-acetylglucosamine acyltransferase